MATKRRRIVPRKIGGMPAWARHYIATGELPVQDNLQPALTRDPFKVPDQVIRKYRPGGSDGAPIRRA